MNKIYLPKNLCENEIEDVLIEYRNSFGAFHLDFSKTQFVSPFAAVLLVLLFHEALNVDQRKIHLILSEPKSPRMKPCMFILSRLGFFDNLPTGVTKYPYIPRKRTISKGTNDAILELTKIEKSEAFEIIDKVEKAITHNTDYPREQKLDICIMVSEMIQNIFYHSGASKSGIIAIQDFKKFGYMQLIIADAGVGIPETIRKCKDYIDQQMTDYETIFEAIKKGVSQFGEGENRGEGLAKCVDLAKRHKAKLYIRSNSGFANITFTNKQGLFGESTCLLGTQIFVNFPHN